MENLSPKFGIVAIIDALGARTQSIEQSLQYLETMHDLRNSVDLAFESFVKAHKEIVGQVNFENLKPRYFGDTVLLTLEVVNKDELLDHFLAISFVLNHIVFEGIQSSILFRGALSIGQYIETDDISLGPAIVDAASWYENIEMIAVMTTPHARNCLKAALTKQSKIAGTASTVMIEYSTPNKLIPGLSTYVLDWPSIVGFDLDEQTEKREIKLTNWFYEHFSLYDIPALVTNKYVNTEQFYFHCVTHNENLTKA